MGLLFRTSFSGPNPLDMRAKKTGQLVAPVLLCRFGRLALCCSSSPLEVHGDRRHAEARLEVDGLLLVYSGFLAPSP